MPIPLIIPSMAVLGFCVAPFVANFLANVIELPNEQPPVGKPYHPLAEDHPGPDYIDESRARETYV